MNDTTNTAAAATTGKGIYINGKEQVIELLQYLSNEEREKLLRNIRLRNPQMAIELSEQSFSFESLEHISTENIKKISLHIPATIMGIALKDSRPNLQKRILKATDRAYAEEAFQTMVSISRPVKDIKRARNKVVETVISLFKRKVIQA